jgi:uncharacterized protein YndB with AHSA1/START domain
MKYAGLWHITTMELWDADSLNMEVQAFIRITREGGGVFQFGLVSGHIDGEVVKTAAGERCEFTWDGNDECDPASGSGWLLITAKSEREGKIKIHHGDSSTLTAKRAK